MFYPNFIRPLLFTIPPETAHRNTFRLARWLSRSEAAHRFLREQYDAQFEELKVTAFGLEFRNPVGLAAGFDKHAEIHSLFPDLGFGHIEIGSVSLRPWPGNPSPRVLRLPQDHALINRYGLNSVGADLVHARLSKDRVNIPVGLNLVKTADPAISGDDAIEDFVQNFTKFYELADFITLNVSCPNTAEGKTFEAPETLTPFLGRLKAAEANLCHDGRRTPVLVKLSLDLDRESLNRILAITEENGISGYVIANTSSRRQGLQTPVSVLTKFGRGGLSGSPLLQNAQLMVKAVFEQTGGRKPIVAVGGIGCDPRNDPAAEAWDYFRAGATLVQVHTGLIYSGPALVKRINTGLMEILRKNKLSSLGEFLATRREEFEVCRPGS